jgi:hypothetical protein
MRIQDLVPHVKKAYNETFHNSHKTSDPDMQNRGTRKQGIQLQALPDKMNVSSPNVNVIDELINFLNLNNIDPTIENIGILKRFLNKDILLDSNLKDLIEKLSLVAADALPEDFSHIRDEIKAIQTLFLDISSDSFIENLDPKRFLEDVLSKLENLRQHITAHGIPTYADSGDIINQIDNLKNSFSFMMELCRYNAYLQLPLNISDFRTICELYIFDRKKRGNNCNESKYVILSLSLPNLGQVTAMIKLENKYVSIHFNTGEEDVIKAFREGFGQLHERLSGAGYKITDIQYRLSDECVNLLNANKLLIDAFNSIRSIDLKI